MKRLIKFKLVDNDYVLEENNEIIFTINSMDLKFISINFYNCVEDPTLCILRFALCVVLVIFFSIIYFLFIDYF